MGPTSLLTNKNLIMFLGGIATAIIGGKVLKSGGFRKAVVKTMASGMKFRDKTMSAIETIREDAQDIYNEAKHQNETDNSAAE